MKHTIAILFSVFFLTGVSAQTPTPPDATRASTNVVGAEYPRIDRERRVIFRVSAPNARSVTVSLGKLALTKGEDGFWTGITEPRRRAFTSTR